MQKRKITLVIALVVCLFLAFRLSRPQLPDPVYAGKPLTFWLDEYNPRRWEDPKLDKQGADEAVRHCGTNAVPVLLRLLRERDVPVAAKLAGLAYKQSFIPIKYDFANWLHEEAIRAFKILGPEASNAVPGLIEIYNENTYPDSKFFVASALAFIGPPARAAIPCLVKGLPSALGLARMDTAIALGRIHAEPGLSVPALTTSLNDSENFVREEAIKSLQIFGPEAKPAVPALIKLLHDNDDSIREQATNALLKIDPQAAAEAGLK